CIDLVFFFQAEDGIRDFHVTGVQTCLFRSSSDRPVTVILVSMLTCPSPYPYSLHAVATHQTLKLLDQHGRPSPPKTRTSPHPATPPTRPYPGPTRTPPTYQSADAPHPSPAHRSEERRVGKACGSRRC